MDEVNCSTCNQSISIENAYVCSCMGVAFCCIQHAEEHPHTKIEDQEHKTLNELKDVPVDLKFRRLVGIGGYTAVLAQLTKAMNNGRIPDDTKEDIALAFSKQSKKNEATIISQIRSLIEHYNVGTIGTFDGQQLLKIWKKDSPRTADKIDNAFKYFLSAAYQRSETFKSDDDVAAVGAKQLLTNTGIALAAALNGDTKVLASGGEAK